MKEKIDNSLNKFLEREKKFIDEDPNLAFLCFVIKEMRKGEADLQKEEEKERLENEVIRIPKGDELIGVKQIAKFLDLSERVIINAICDRNNPLPCKIDSEEIKASKQELLKYIDNVHENFSYREYRSRLESRKGKK